MPILAQARSPRVDKQAKAAVQCGPRLAHPLTMAAMLKKIPVTLLRLGMHLHAMEGAWIDHPFWKSRFVLRDPLDLQRLRDSAVRECWINTDLGLDVAAADATPGAAPRRDGSRALPARPRVMPSQDAATAAPPQLPQASRSMNEELRQAAVVCKQGRQAVVSMFNEARMGKALDAESCMPLVDDISSSVMRNPGALVSLARLKTQDDYSYMHSVAVCALMVSLARQQGMDDETCRSVGLAGLLHDLGKALMPVEVLNKPGRLTDEEFAIMRTHPQRGHELLLEGNAVGADALEVCLHHHEKFDGSGYPHRLAGHAITPVARMAAVCDVYDAITSNRPYKAGWDPAESIARMASWKGHFDETVFSAFVRGMGIYPTGSLVRLASNRLAVVMEQNPQALVAPVVKVFFSTDKQMHVRPARLDLSRPGCNDRISGRESPAEWGFGRLDELWLDPDILRRTS
jgi:HD-GYP domain-containing protein (c-di-GMP phosphodiesterase class II)